METTDAPDHDPPASPDEPKSPPAELPIELAPADPPRSEPAAEPSPKPAPAEAPAPKTIDSEKPVEPVGVRDDWGESLARLREIARRHAGEPGEAAQAWGIRARVLDWVAGEGDDPRGGNVAVWNRVIAALSTATTSETVDEATVAHHLATAIEALEAFAPLQVRVLAICRKVNGFGQYEPFEGAATVSGRTLLVYCEMTGLTSEAVDGEYRSRLSTRVEVVPVAGGEAVWSQALGTAEDQCRRRRRDYYVNYRLVLPASVAPGAYTLRMSQTDFLTGRTASASSPFTIAP
jgi:hypothetical protein